MYRCPQTPSCMQSRQCTLAKIQRDTPRTMSGANTDALHRLRSAIICSFDLAAVSSTEAKNAIVEAKTFIDQVESQMKDPNGQLEGSGFTLSQSKQRAGSPVFVFAASNKPAGQYFCPG